MLARIGARVDELLFPRLFAIVTVLLLRGAKPGDVHQPLRDLDQIRGFPSGLGPTALCDLPWISLFVVGCSLLDPWLGWLSVGGAR